jgi:hypothetical protein
MYGSNLSGDGRGLFPYMIPAWGLVCMMENNSAASMSCDDLTYRQQKWSAWIIILFMLQRINNL